MEVATPTEDCLMLIYDLLCPIVKIRDEGTLDRQEVLIVLVMICFEKPALTATGMLFTVYSRVRLDFMV